MHLILHPQLKSLRELHQGTPRNPKARMVNNLRPPQPLHHRPLRTNIHLKTKPTCSTGAVGSSYYRGGDEKNNIIYNNTNPPVLPGRWGARTTEVGVEK